MTKWKLVPVEPTQEMVWKAEEDSPPFHHGDPWYGSEPPSEGQINAIYKAMLEVAPQPEPLSDERIFKLFLEKAVDKGTAGIYDFARAIEREILGRLGMTRDDISKLAIDAGVSIRGHYDETGSTPAELQRFAELVAAAEREECAKVCDDYAVDQWNLYKGRHPYTGEESGRADPETQGQCLGAEYLANAIRAMNEKGTA